ncbi:MAG: MFS transporter [Clostridium sp.]|nr:MFS transporter [Clostridium sp.]
MLKIKKQISILYASSVLGNLSLTGAWVAILSARGYSLIEIGIAETIFHIVSILFELPSGILADVFGRKNMLLVSSIMKMAGNLIMIFSSNLFMVCSSLAFYALSYNFASGSGDALAYDSMKMADCENEFEQYESNQLIIHRICGGISTLCAGFALFLGHRIAYGTDIVICNVQILMLLSLREVPARQAMQEKSKKGSEIKKELMGCIKKSIAFMRKAKKAFALMLCNSFVGAVDILLLFFLQAKLLEKGISKWELGFALLFMEMGGIVGAKLILKAKKLSYKSVFVIAAILVMAGILAEHSPMYVIMTLGGFLSAIGDDALQVRTNARLQDMFPSEQRATLTSLDSFSFSMIMVVLTPLAGIVFSYW